MFCLGGGTGERSGMEKVIFHFEWCVIDLVHSEWYFWHCPRQKYIIFCSSGDLVKFEDVDVLELVLCSFGLQDVATPPA